MSLNREIRTLRAEIARFDRRFDVAIANGDEDTAGSFAIQTMMAEERLETLLARHTGKSWVRTQDEEVGA